MEIQTDREESLSFFHSLKTKRDVGGKAVGRHVLAWMAAGGGPTRSHSFHDYAEAGGRMVGANNKNDKPWSRRAQH